MARILIGGKTRWYDELRAVAYYNESEVESWILHHAASIFPDHLLFPFKKGIVSRTTQANRKPDLALIQRDFSAWTIIEVELEGHTLSHVLDQTRVFLDGDYNTPEVAEYAKKQLWAHCRHTASIKRLTKLFSGHAPSVMVVVDGPSPKWEQDIKEAGVNLCLFEVYKNAGGQYVYRTAGQYPTIASHETQCRPHQTLANTLEVTGTFEFTRLRKDTHLDIVFDGSLTQWTLLTDNAKQYLRFNGSSNPLSPSGTYRLFRSRHHIYFLERN